MFANYTHLSIGKIPVCSHYFLLRLEDIQSLWKYLDLQKIVLNLFTKHFDTGVTN